MAAGDTIEADYVVVGAGSAGCVMAARLSEDAANKVVLLEAGGNDNHFWIHVPLGFGKTFADPKVNWMFETEPQPQMQNRVIQLTSQQQRPIHLAHLIRPKHRQIGTPRRPIERDVHMCILHATFAERALQRFQSFRFPLSGTR